MAVLGVDDFKSKLRGGGARPNLFKATINFPGYANGDAELTSFLCETAQLPGSTLGQIVVPKYYIKKKFYFKPTLLFEEIKEKQLKCAFKMIELFIKRYSKNK